MSNVTINTKTNFADQPSVPIDQKLNATEFNQIPTWVNEPSQSLTAFTDTDIIVDGSKDYETTKVITASTHTITANATLSSHKKGNSIVVEYQFDVDCDLTLTNFYLGRSTIGTVNPIPAGTYSFWFFATSKGVSLVIQNNTGTTPGTLSTPTLVLTTGSGQLGYVITGIDANATAGVLEYSDDNITFTPWGSYTFGVETGNITGLTNGVLYYGRYRNSAAGYNPSNYATDTATPSASIIQLTELTLGVATVAGGQATIPFTNPNSSNEDQNQLYYKLATEPTTWTTGVTAVTGATTFPAQTGLTNDLEYDFKAVAEGSGVYSDSNDSNEVSATPTGYLFTNTHRLVIDAASEGILTVNNAAVDEIIAFETWYTTTADVNDVQNLIHIRDTTGNVSKILIWIDASGDLLVKFSTDGSNNIISKFNVTLFPNTRYHMVFGKTGATVGTIYCRLDDVDRTGGNFGSVGTYSGLNMVGDFEIDIANSSGGVPGEGKYDLFRLFNWDIDLADNTYLYNVGDPVGLLGDVDLLNNCTQEWLLNNNANADNIGVNGTPVGAITYESI